MSRVLREGTKVQKNQMSAGCHSVGKRSSRDFKTRFAKRSHCYFLDTSPLSYKMQKHLFKQTNKQPFKTSSEQTGDLLLSSEYNKHCVCSKADALEDEKFRSERNRHQRTKMHCFKVRIMIRREGKKGGERKEARRRRSIPRIPQMLDEHITPEHFRVQVTCGRRLNP